MYIVLILNLKDTEQLSCPYIGENPHYKFLQPINRSREKLGKLVAIKRF